MIVAIDGPAGSGKTTIAKKLAQLLGIFYLDTGATYRTLTLKAISEDIPLNDQAKLITLADNLEIEFKNNKVFLEGRDVTDSIRTPLIDEKISLVCSPPKVREAMVRLQRRIVGNRDSVVEGRDITTVVFPDSNNKFYLDASIIERAKRRYSQLKQKKIDIDYEEVKEQMQRRDTADLTRKNGPLKKAENAAYIDTTGLSISQVLKKIKNKINYDN
jgi:cytidylate kinase